VVFISSYYYLSSFHVYKASTPQPVWELNVFLVPRPSRVARNRPTVAWVAQVCNQSTCCRVLRCWGGGAPTYRHADRRPCLGTVWLALSHKHLNRACSTAAVAYADLLPGCRYSPLHLVNGLASEHFSSQIPGRRMYME